MDGRRPPIWKTDRFFLTRGCEANIRLPCGVGVRLVNIAVLPNQGVYHEKPETLNQGWCGSFSCLVFLSVNYYQRFTCMHSPLSFTPSSPPPPLQENISKQESGLGHFSCQDREVSSQGKVLQKLIWVSHTQGDKGSRSRASCHTTGGGLWWGLGLGNRPHSQEEPVIHFLVAEVTTDGSRVFFLAGVHVATKHRNLHTGPLASPQRNANQAVASLTWRENYKFVCSSIWKILLFRAEY